MKTFTDYELALTYFSLLNATVTALCDNVTYRIIDECEESFKLIDTKGRKRWAKHYQIKEYHVSITKTDTEIEPTTNY